MYEIARYRTARFEEHVRFLLRHRWLLGLSTSTAQAETATAATETTATEKAATVPVATVTASAQAATETAQIALVTAGLSTCTAHGAKTIKLRPVMNAYLSERLMDGC